jgi:hypothetical protein
MIVRVHELDEEKQRQVLAALSNLGLYVTTGEESLEESELLYTARINSKLDNLGQLKHLFKSSNEMRKLSDSLTTYYDDLWQERMYRQSLLRRFASNLAAEYGFLLTLTPEYMTKEEITAAYEIESAARKEL